MTRKLDCFLAPGAMPTYTNRVETKPAAQAGCQFKAFEGFEVPSGCTTVGGAKGSASAGGPASGPLQLM
jgi:hypothetical protein